MTQPVHAIVLHRFAASAEQVFAAWFDPVWLGRWMFGPGVRDERIVRLTLDARVGGRFSFIVEREGREINYVGEYLEVERPRLLVFTWGLREDLPDTSRVIVELTSLDRGCELKLTHLMGAQWSAQADQVADIWTRMLDALAEALRQDDSAAKL
ncbi:MAG: SRPBCC domain-containing protein [Verrucomicrobia bacterium]|nr:SRPBCC domain-containing protein [Verrucomicrobiota bacterium]